VSSEFPISERFASAGWHASCLDYMEPDAKGGEGIAAVARGAHLSHGESLNVIARR